MPSTVLSSNTKAVFVCALTEYLEMSNVYLFNRKHMFISMLVQKSMPGKKQQTGNEEKNAICG